jgi:phospholipid/cholesterol/gamma-HCH transport system substrate-binding protein
METNVNYSVVGAFVIVLLSAIIFGIIWLSSGLSFQSSGTFMVYMQESVAGLSIDAPVEYNGVNVGSVKSIDLNRKNPHLVELLLTIKNDTPITLGTVATLNTKGITGVAYIALKDNSTNLTPLRASPGQRYPVIKTAPSLFLRVDTALNKLSDSFSRVSYSIQTLLDPQNQNYIKRILKNLDDFTTNLSGNNKNINSLILNTSHASEQLTPALRTFINQTLPAMNNLINNLDSVSKNLKENPSILIRGTQQQTLGPGE